MNKDREIHILGAGVAGLRCASLLQDEGFEVVVHERSSSVGGRMKTDEVDGFLLDHGFHVMQTGYPTSAAVIDFDALGAEAFSPGARILRAAGSEVRLTTYADPFRDPLASLGALKHERWIDLLKVAKLRLSTLFKWPHSSFEGGDETTQDFLTGRGAQLSSEFVDRFFRPLFAGIFLESELRTSERMFRFIFGSMSRGEMVLPERGIRSYPESLAEKIGWDRVQLSSEAHAESPTSLRVNGELLEVGQVILAYPEQEPGEERSVWTVHMRAPASPAPGGYLILNGDYSFGSSLIAHVAVPSDVQPSYSPGSEALVTATIVGDAADALGLDEASQIESRAREELRSWFPASADWSTLDVQEIRRALPERGPGSGLSFNGEWQESGLIRCGDQQVHGSIEGALRSAANAACLAVQRLRESEAK